jgi:hypothetical protein
MLVVYIKICGLEAKVFEWKYKCKEGLRLHSGGGGGGGRG